LAWIPWDDLQQRQFQRDPDRPDKFDHYQAEALAHEHVPVVALDSIICYTRDVQKMVDRAAMERGLEMRILADSRWYFL